MIYLFIYISPIECALKKCQVLKVIFFLNNQRSSIDYILMSKELIHKVDQVFIDEEGKYNLNSDNVIMSIKIIHSN